MLRLDGDNLHLVAREGDKVDAHVQFNATGIYLDAEGEVALLRYATVMTVLQDIVKELNDTLEQAVESIPAEEIPTDAEMSNLVNQAANLIFEAAIQEASDAAVLASAAMSFADKFKPEYILDVKEEYGALTISLRSEAFATAFAEAVDEMMLNADLAKLVDRQAALTGGKTFAEAQVEWLKYREATLKAIRTIQSSDTINENGHWTSHFQIGEENSAVKILICDMDSWIDVENGEVEFAVCLGFKDEDSFLVYEFAVNPYAYSEKLTAGNSWAEINCEIENNRISSGKIVTVDFYQDGDSLVSELYTNQSDRMVQFKISRIDKVDIEDLSASEKITEITVDDIYNGLGALLKLAFPGLTTETETAK